MINKKNKKAIILVFFLLTIFIFNIFSSVLIFQQANHKAKKEVVSHMLFYITQYEYELTQTNIALNKVYYEKNASWKDFDKWFNILYSRVENLSLGNLNKSINKTIFDITKIKNIILDVDKTFYSKEQNRSKKNILKIKNMLQSMSKDIHTFIQYEKLNNRIIWKNQKEETFLAFRNSIIINILTLIFCLVIVYILYKNNKKLNNLRKSLEKRIKNRTKKVLLSNNTLKLEIKERLKIEKKLRNSYLEIKEKNALVQQQANYDFLTSLANKHLLLTKLKESSIQSINNKKEFILLFLDLDRFKYVNDTFGHNIGDKLLKEVSLRLLKIIDKKDTASRLGGDEFAIIFPNFESLEKIEKLITKILKSLEEAYYIEGNEAHISASIGLSIYPKDGTTCETLMRKADAAMYKAKQKGKNNFQFFTAEMDKEIQERTDLEIGLHKAIEKKEFELHYQPIIDLKTNKIISTEALIRWNHPKKGYISPATFIPLAEEIGLISVISQWVIKKACKDAALWHKNFEDAPKVSVNISSKLFQLTNMPILIKEVLEKSSLSAKNLILEITESLLVNDDVQTLKQLDDLKKMGIVLSIDDFGTGFSSLSYLKKFPISILKIDKSFIMDINKNEENQALVGAIIVMAKSLKLAVVAEGIETKEQEKFLQILDATYAQGFLYSKALNVKDFSAYFLQNQA